MTDQDVYTRLREFLDTMPAGYPATPTGVEIRILKKLFTPEDAELVLKLKAEPESVSTLAGRIGANEAELAERLEALALKGLIFRMRSEDGPLYMAVQFVIGIYEFQINNLDREFCEMFEEYLPYLGVSWSVLKTRQLRIIPVHSAVEAAKSVEPYNRVRALVEGQDLISVSPCICRKEQELLGHACNHPREICIGFGPFAQYYLDNNMARRIDGQEALALLDRAEASGLVLSPVNSQELNAICCCCSCCCPNLKYTKMMPRPADMIQSYYQARVDPDLCTACGDCMDRCPMDAIEAGENVSRVTDGRCIGCGLCVSACPAEAITLDGRPDRLEAPPADLADMMNRIATERARFGAP